MSTLSFDLEADGFLDSLTQIFCIVTEDVETGEIEAYYENKKDIYQGLLSLYNADRIVGHNIIGFDIPAIRKLHPKWTYHALDDTFLLSCILSPLRPSHSIESYSDGFKVENSDWSCLTHNMLDRCVIDTKVCTKIYKSFLKRIEKDKGAWDRAIALEYQVAINHVRQVEAGVDIDLDAVYKTIECLDAEIEGLIGCIDSQLPYRCIPDKNNFKKVFKKDGSLQNYVSNYFLPMEVKSINDDLRIVEG